MNKIELIQYAKEQCLAGTVLSREEVAALLDIPVGSQEDLFMRETADQVAKIITGGEGCIWCAVGMDYTCCGMNCRFCSFGEKWGVIQESRHVTEEEIMDSARRYAEGGADYIILRTTEFFDFDRLIEYVPEMRKKIPGDYKVVLNTCEIDAKMAEKAAKAGVYGAYHALRLREGTDTPFDPEHRKAAMQVITDSQLELISLTEPIGPEHTNEEIADCFLNTVEHGAVIGGVMARIPVKGTPLGDTRRLTDEEIAHITAALRLSGGNVIEHICVHPASELAMRSGGSMLVVESGAIPRDTRFQESDWADTDMIRAKELLEKGSYVLEPDLNCK